MFKNKVIMVWNWIFWKKFITHTLKNIKFKSVFIVEMSLNSMILKIL